jgi:hypothetical protein
MCVEALLQQKDGLSTTRFRLEQVTRIECSLTKTIHTILESLTHTETAALVQIEIIVSTHAIYSPIGSACLRYHALVRRDFPLQEHGSGAELGKRVLPPYITHTKNICPYKHGLALGHFLRIIKGRKPSSPPIIHFSCQRTIQKQRIPLPLILTYCINTLSIENRVPRRIYIYCSRVGTAQSWPHIKFRKNLKN